MNEVPPSKPDIPHSHRVGIIVERRESDNPWIDATWNAVGVMADPPGDDTWKDLDSGPGWNRMYAGSLEIGLFKRETEDYKMNLSQPAPSIYVVLRPEDENTERDVTPFMATCSPYEAECYTMSGEMLIDAVPMPPSLMAWLAAFVEAYHVDEPFKKRKQKRKDFSATERGPQGQARVRDDQ